MQFTFAHNNLNVLNLSNSVAFYKEALGLQEVRRIDAPDGSFSLIFLGDGQGTHQLELTCIKGREAPYNLGENEFHVAFYVDDFAAAYTKHKAMGCICYENQAMGLYFINDPDGYWLEILPKK